jgi:hemoglobin-like flavoprotein
MNVNLLASTFAKVEPQADRFAANFYQILFDLDPTIARSMSGVPPQKYHQEFLDYVKLMVDNADNEKAIQFIFRNLGQKYAPHRDNFGDYSLVGAALFQSLKDYAMSDWTPEVERAWQSTFQTAANAAIEGARSMGDRDAPPISSHDDASDSLLNLLPQMLATNGQTVDRSRPIPRKSKSRSIPLLLGAIAMAILVGGGYFVWSRDRSPSNNSPAPTAK